MAKPQGTLETPNRADDLRFVDDGSSANHDSLTALLAITSHELRHPLHLMRLALARYFPRGDERVREVLERYVDRMARVVGDMADLVRLEQDAMPLTPAWIDITQMLRDVVDAYLPDAALRKIKLTLEGTTTPLWIHGDEQRLLQVLSNVVDNALKFTQVEGSIQVTLIRGGASLEVRVRDTGQGISAEQMPKVFDLYATATAPRGLGIGLTVARRIVELHGGSIDVLSEGPDQGTEVVIVLPGTNEQERFQGASTWNSELRIKNSERNQSS